MNPIKRDGVIIHFVLVLLCLFLSSCARRQTLQQNNPDVQPIVVHQDSVFENRLLDTIIQQEAMLVDIPIPLYDERILPTQSCCNSDTLIFGYKSSLTRQQLVDFFMTQMERYGWQHLVTFETTESLMQFASPDRYCTVVIQDEGTESKYSRIFLYIKRASS